MNRSGLSSAVSSSTLGRSEHSDRLQAIKQTVLHKVDATVQKKQVEQQHIDTNFNSKFQEVGERFDEAREISEKTFSIVDGQLGTIAEFIEKDRAEKEEVEASQR